MSDWLATVSSKLAPIESRAKPNEPVLDTLIRCDGWNAMKITPEGTAALFKFRQLNVPVKSYTGWCIIKPIGDTKEYTAQNFREGKVEVSLVDICDEHGNYCEAKAKAFYKHQLRIHNVKNFKDLVKKAKEYGNLVPRDSSKAPTDYGFLDSRLCRHYGFTEISKVKNFGRMNETEPYGKPFVTQALTSKYKKIVGISA